MKFIVVVDMQNDFIDGALGSPEAQTIVPKMAEFLINRDEDTRVIFTRDTHQNNYLTNTQEGRKLPVPHCIAGTDGWRIHEDLLAVFESQFDYTILHKDTFGCVSLPETIKFYLDNYYINHDDPNIEITFCGVCTDICVISNVLLIKTYFPEAKIIVRSDLCAGVTPESHQRALDAMASCQIDIV